MQSLGESQMASSRTCSALDRTHKDLTCVLRDVGLCREERGFRDTAPVLAGFGVSVVVTTLCNASLVSQQINLFDACLNNLYHFTFFLLFDR